MSQTTEGFKIIQDIIKLKWVPEVLSAIGTDGATYSEILKKVDYLSNTELNRKLAVLVERKAVEKVETDGHSRYRLLPFGKDLDHIFRHFREIEEKYSIA
ncbi:MAG: Transcriptional regulator, HxlR family [Lachnoclostridium sp.]|jgi:DNA-binding HxlR family transcriptional regulator